MFSRSKSKLIIKRIPQTTQNKIFLTFDDGPGLNTKAVLALLKKHHCSATFFVIGQKAENQPEIINDMISQNHSVYSHSVDHDYFNYFKNENIISDWMLTSIKQLNQITKNTSYAFRPPAGILNPPLVAAALKLKIPLILWTHRFYDTVFKLNKTKIDIVLMKIKPGDIVLLHDEQKTKNTDAFLSSLDYFLSELKKKSFIPTALTDSDIFSCL